MGFADKSMKDLQEIARSATAELDRRVKKLQETCEHPEWRDIYFALGEGFYVPRCFVCQIPKFVYDDTNRHPVPPCLFCKVPVFGPVDFKAKIRNVCQPCYRRETSGLLTRWFLRLFPSPNPLMDTDGRREDTRRGVRK